ncbi:MAG: CPBP family intramembrane metalloprotease [Methanobacteriaceae archaeon]|nr:CPBP family intramembrane metalloprotease [Methanobacteriaceae archaeon]
MGIIWHLPVLLVGSYVGGTPLWWTLPIFIAGTITASFIYSWLTIKSKSLWPAVLLHASDNYFTQHLFEPLATGNLVPWLLCEGGILVLAIVVIFALTFWMLKYRLPDLTINRQN